MDTHRLALKPGYVLEHFRIEAVLGKGGFGITYLAVDVRLGKRVAIKELLPDTIATRVEGSTVGAHSVSLEEDWQWAKDRFVEEAQMLAGFSHPAIVGVQMLTEANGTVYMVMDYVEGESYEARLRRIGTESDEGTLMEVIAPILEGLQEVHARGLLHRDIKPENILIKNNGQPVLIDFGAARESVGKTVTMTSMVTHGYSPIEQYQSKGKMGPWTDIYAVGAVMCRAMTGEKPPVAADRVMDDEFEWLSYRELPQFSEEFRQTVDWALRVRPDERPQLLSEFVEHLSLRDRSAILPEAEIENPGLHSPLSSEAPPSVSASQTEVQQPLLRPRPQRLIPAMSAALIVLLAIGAGAFVILDQRSKRLPRHASAEEAQKREPQEQAPAHSPARKQGDDEQRAALEMEAAEHETAGEAEQIDQANVAPVPPAVMTDSRDNESIASVSPLISAQMAGRFSGDVGLVDMNKVFTSYYKTKEAETRLNDARAVAKTELDERLALLKSEMEEIIRLEAQAEDRGISSSAREAVVSLRDEKINEVRNLDREIGEFREKREKQLLDHFMRMRGDIVQDIMKVIDSAAPRNALAPTLFFDTSSLGLSQVKLVLGEGPRTAALSDAIVLALNANKAALANDNIRLNRDLSIGLVDMNKVFTSYYKTKEAETRLNDARAVAKTELDERLALLKSELEEINRLEAQAEDRGISSSAREATISLRDERINEVRNLDREIGEFREKRENQLQDHFMRMRGDIVQDIIKAVDSLTAGESNYVLFDTSGLGISQVPALVYAGDQLARLDDDIIRILNQQGPASSTTSGKEARELKIAVVDMNKVFTSLRETRAAETELDDARNRAKLEIDRKSKTTAAEEIEKLRKKLEEDLQAKFNQRRTQIVNRIRESVSAICKEENVDIVFDTSALGISQVKFVLFASGLPDLTDKARSRSEM